MNTIAQSPIAKQVRSPVSPSSPVLVPKPTNSARNFSIGRATSDSGNEPRSSGPSLLPIYLPAMSRTRPCTAVPRIPSQAPVACSRGARSCNRRRGRLLPCRRRPHVVREPDASCPHGSWRISEPCVIPGEDEPAGRHEGAEDDHHCDEDVALGLRHWIASDG